MRAAIYDALEQKAAEVGGVGAGRCFEEDSKALSGTPRCLAGLAIACGFIVVDETCGHTEAYAKVSEAAEEMFGRTPLSLDSAIERAFPFPGADRAPFAGVMRELGIAKDPS